MSWPLVSLENILAQPLLNGCHQKGMEFGEGSLIVRMVDLYRGDSINTDALDRVQYPSQPNDDYLLESGDILINRTSLKREGVAKASLMETICEPTYFDCSIIRARLNEEKAVPRYVVRSLGSPLVRAQVMSIAKTATITTVSQPGIRILQIPLPPLAEQKRIAAILDVADALRAKRRESLAQLDNLLQSTFLDMFGDPVTNPKEWKIVPLGSVLDVKGGFAFKSTDYLESSLGAPLIRIGEVNRCDFNSRTLAQLPVNYFEKYERFVVRKGAILMSLTGTVGKDDYGNAVTLNGDVDCYLLNQRVAELIPSPKLNSNYLHRVLAHQKIKNKLTGRSRGVRQANISNGDIKELQVPLPPLDRQHTFATVVESVEKQKARLREHLAELDTLFASLQQRAFNGDL